MPKLSPLSKRLLIASAALVAFVPIWDLAIAPRLFPNKIACVISQPDGTIEKAWGEAACINNGSPTVVLRPQE